MKKNQTIRFALDVLEQEMDLLSKSEIMNILGGEDPIPSTYGNYCSFNQLGYLANKFGVTANADPRNFVANYNSQYGTSGIAFDDYGNVNGTTIGSGSNYDSFMNSMFTTSGLDVNDTASWGNSLKPSDPNCPDDHNYISISSKSSNGEPGHAFVIEKQQTNGMFKLVDTTTGNESFRSATQIKNDYTQAKLVSGCNSSAFTSDGWSSSQMSAFTQPPSGGNVSGH